MQSAQRSKGESDYEMITEEQARQSEDRDYFQVHGSEPRPGPDERDYVQVHDSVPRPRGQLDADYVTVQDSVPRPNARPHEPDYIQVQGQEGSRGSEFPIVNPRRDFSDLDPVTLQPVVAGQPIVRHKASDASSVSYNYPNNTNRPVYEISAPPPVLNGVHGDGHVPIHSRRMSTDRVLVCFPTRHIIDLTINRLYRGEHR